MGGGQRAVSFCDALWRGPSLAVAVLAGEGVRRKVPDRGGIPVRLRVVDYRFRGTSEPGGGLVNTGAEYGRARHVVVARRRAQVSGDQPAREFGRAIGGACDRRGVGLVGRRSRGTTLSCTCTWPTSPTLIPKSWR